MYKFLLLHILKKLKYLYLLKNNEVWQFLKACSFAAVSQKQNVWSFSEERDTELQDYRKKSGTDKFTSNPSHQCGVAKVS